MLSKFSRTRLIAEKENLNEELASVLESLESARNLGDLRENAEFQAAKENYTLIVTRIMEINESLADEETPESMGNVISYGKLLEIKYLGETDSNNQLISNNEVKTYFLVFDKGGESVISGTLSDESDLGRLVKDGREGIYYLSRGRTSLVYEVKILGEEHYEEFLERFPVDKKKKIASLLEGGR